MLELIVRTSLDIVDRTERLIDRARRLIESDKLDDIEAYKIRGELEHLTDVVFVIDEATRLLRRTMQQRPEIARPYTVHATLQ